MYLLKSFTGHFFLFFIVAGSAPDISSLMPNISIESVMINDTHCENIYLCDIEPLSEQLLYEIRWFLTPNLGQDKLIHQSYFIQYESKDDFRLATILREDQLLDNNVPKSEFTVSAQMLDRDNAETPDTWFRSKNKCIFSIIFNFVVFINEWVYVRILIFGN